MRWMVRVAIAAMMAVAGSARAESAGNIKSLKSGLDAMPLLSYARAGKRSPPQWFKP